MLAAAELVYYDCRSSSTLRRVDIVGRRRYSLQLLAALLLQWVTRASATMMNLARPWRQRRSRRGKDLDAAFQPSQEAQQSFDRLLSSAAGLVLETDRRLKRLYVQESSNAVEQPLGWLPLCSRSADPMHCHLVQDYSVPMASVAARTNFMVADIRSPMRLLGLICNCIVRPWDLCELRQLTTVVACRARRSRAFRHQLPRPL